MNVVNIIDNIKFFFSKPNYKIGNTVRFWNTTYRITGVYRDWSFLGYMYQLEGTLINPSEDLLKFYNKDLDRRRY